MKCSIRNFMAYDIYIELRQHVLNVSEILLLEELKQSK